MKKLPFWYSLLWSLRLSLFLGLFVAILFWSGFQASAMVTNLRVVNTLHESAVPHVEQSDLLALVVAGQSKNAFEGPSS